MGIENLNRFHWALLGVLLGVALGYSWSSNSDDVEGMVSSDQVSFERDVTQKDAASGLPLIKGVIIHPAEFSQADNCDVNLVTYKRLGRDLKSGKYGWIDKRIIAKIPFVPQLRGRMSPTPDLTVSKYLAELAKTNPNVSYNDGWWLIPKNAAIIGGSAGLVLIGGIWPTLLGLMTGAGMAPKPKPKEKKKERSLWSYKSSTPEVKAKAGPSAADQAEVQAIADSYERNLAASATERTEAPVAQAATPEEIRKLQTAPLEATSSSSGETDEVELKDKEYYPVVIHHHKKDEKKPGT
ncbi:MAG TPA: hypothetical protein VHD56_18465 [Tepidisphaeraceae bacterium]|nr:hypothetical protein [Tepidisphaeraceae bacterium]